MSEAAGAAAGPSKPRVSQKRKRTDSESGAAGPSEPPQDLPSSSKRRKGTGADA